jgi:hypothetical protein
MSPHASWHVSALWLTQPFIVFGSLVIIGGYRKLGLCHGLSMFRVVMKHWVRTELIGSSLLTSLGILVYNRPALITHCKAVALLFMAPLPL